MNYKLFVLIAAVFMLNSCDRPAIETVEEASLISEFEGRYESETSKGQVSIKFYDAISDEELAALGSTESIEVKGGGTASSSMDIDPVPIDEVCPYYYGPTGGGDPDDEDCVGSVWNSFLFGFDGSCLDFEPCWIGGSIYGRSGIGEECDWEVESFGTIKSSTGGGFRYSFDAVIDCGDYEIIDVRANGTLVDQYVVGCSECLLLYSTGF